MDVDKENLGRLTNDDLFKIMKKYGISVGPISASTRSVYEKKLKNYLEAIENGQTTTSPANTTMPVTITRQQKVDVLSASSIEPDTRTTPPSAQLSATAAANRNTTTVTNVPPAETTKNKRHTLEPSAFQQQSFQSSQASSQTRQPTMLSGVYEDGNQQSRGNSSGGSSNRVVVAEPHSSTQNTHNTTPYPSQSRTQPVQDRARVTTEKPKIDLEFKLIKPSTGSAAAANATSPLSTTTTTTTTYVLPSSSTSFMQSNVSNRRADTNKDYGLLDDRQPTTLSSGFRLQETNIRSRATISHVDRPFNTNFNMNTSSSVVTPKREDPRPVHTQNVAKPQQQQGKSMFNLKYLILVGVLFTMVYFLITHIQSNPDNPVEFMN